MKPMLFRLPYFRFEDKNQAVGILGFLNNTNNYNVYVSRNLETGWSRQLANLFTKSLLQNRPYLLNHFFDFDGFEHFLKILKWAK